MKNNRLVYIFLAMLMVWCLFLTSQMSNNKQTENNEIINEYNVTGFSTDLTKIVDECKNSIVSINANGNISTGFVYKQVDDNIYILTSYHGVAEASSIYAFFASGFNINATLLGKNIYADLAILQVQSPYDVHTLNLADATMLNSGEFVISIGTPYSLDYDQTVELGMVSNENRTIENSITVVDEAIDYYMDVIQLSSNLKPGYSGSPVLNMNGEVVGMTTMSIDDRLNFAIEANEIKIIADKIISGENVKKYQLGIKGDYICNMQSFEKSNLNIPVDIINGLYIRKLMDNSIASISGVKTGNILLSINGTKLNNLNDYLAVVYSETNYFDFEVYRDGEIINYRIDIND